ncbi:MAG: DUF4236 domain-containing protein, partial [Pedobacter sp.]
MGFRFSKRINLFKGLGINLSKSGFSFSIKSILGSINTKSYSVKTGISGLSYRKKFKNGSGKASLIFLLVFLNLNSCSWFNSQTSQSADSELDKKLNSSKEIIDYIPKSLTKHEDIKDYFESFIEIGDDFYKDSYGNLDDLAHLEMSNENMENASKKDDLVGMLVSTTKTIKELGNTVGGAFPALWNATKILGLKSDRDN